MKSFFGFVMSY